MKIAVIGAMGLEVSLLRDALQNRRTSHIGRFEFHEGIIHGVPVVLSQSGIGKVSAAVATALLIDKHSPDLIINTGTAGGLGDTSVHDLVWATEVRHHDVDVTAFGYELGQQAQMPAAFVPESKWHCMMRDIAAQHGRELHEGLVVSGDSFIHDPERLRQIERHFPKALAVEMEAAAIAQTCYLLDTPFVMLRAISDKAGEGDAVSYGQFVDEAGRISAAINIDFMKEIQEML
ncbi:MAG: 5'-methylthioadenosine/adenosylhomocysteine nucleosidase [Capnocytophaga sp.]|nr:5'-methylthioadenosine/adenosylhomocysteine nucleosidase [Capnocytophaga sp.]